MRRWVKFEEMGKRIKECRMRKGLTQETVAEKMFMRRETYNTIENGKRNLKADEICRLSELLDTDADYILRGTNNKYLSIQSDTGLPNKCVEALINICSGKNFDGTDNDHFYPFDNRDAVEFFLSSESSFELLNMLYHHIKMRFDYATTVSSSFKQHFRPSDIVFIDGESMFMYNDFSAEDFEQMSALRLIERIKQVKEEINNREKS